MNTDPMQRIRERFVLRCRDDLVALRRLDPSNPADTGRLVAMSHSLAGGGGTLGFPELSVRAAEVETLLGEQGAGAEGVRPAFDALLRELEETVRTFPATD